MPTPISMIPAKRRVHRKRRPIASRSGGTLTLVSAEYEPTAAVTLTFGRAIDIAGIDGAAITVYDGTYGFLYDGTGGVTLVNPTTVQIVLAGVEDWFEPGVTMTATAANGIVAAGDGAAWAGVTDLELPFP